MYSVKILNFRDYAMEIYLVDENKYFDSEMSTTIIKCAEIVLGYEGTHESAELTISFVKDTRMRELNREYRNIDKTTDVLSFSQDGPEPYLLGDIVISVETAERHALSYGVTRDQEIIKLIVHGALHLLGYDHKKKNDREAMRSKEDEIKSVIRREFEG